MTAKLRHDAGATETGEHYYVVFDDAADPKQSWEPGSSAFGAYTTTRSDFAVAATEIAGTGLYHVTIPSGISARQLRWRWFKRVGGSYSHTDDELYAEGEAYWNGTVLVTETGDTFARLGAPNGASFADDIAAIQTAATVSAVVVDKKHTWRFDRQDQLTAPNRIEENLDFDSTLAMDFSGAINDSASIFSSQTPVVSSSDEDAELPTVDNVRLSQDRKQVHFDLDANEDPQITAGTYTVTIQILTTDNNTITRKGTLVLR